MLTLLIGTVLGGAFIYFALAGVFNGTPNTESENVADYEPLESAQGDQEPFDIWWFDEQEDEDDGADD